MKLNLSVGDIDDVEATLKVTMTISEWKRFEDQLAQQHPSWKIKEIISDFIQRSYKEYREEISMRNDD